MEETSQAALIAKLLEQNNKLLAQVSAMQKKNKAEAAEPNEAEADQPNEAEADQPNEAEAEADQPKKRRTTHPRTKPKLRRSPRNHSPAPTPSPKATPPAAMRRRLSYTSTPGDKRNTPGADKQLVRYTLGVCIKAQLDDTRLAQHFRA